MEINSSFCQHAERVKNVEQKNVEPIYYINFLHYFFTLLFLLFTQIYKSKYGGIYG